MSHPTFKPLCSAQQEHFIESDGKESSLIIELKPGSYGMQHASCSRILSAPPSYGFIVRLILPKLRHGQHSVDHSVSGSSIMPAAVSTTKPQQTAEGGSLGSSSNSALTGMSTLIERLNSTAAAAHAGAIVGRTCPLNIVSVEVGNEKRVHSLYYALHIPCKRRRFYL